MPKFCSSCIQPKYLNHSSFFWISKPSFFSSHPFLNLGSHIRGIWMSKPTSKFEEEFNLEVRGEEYLNFPTKSRVLLECCSKSKYGHLILSIEDGNPKFNLTLLYEKYRVKVSFQISALYLKNNNHSNGLFSNSIEYHKIIFPNSRFIVSSQERTKILFLSSPYKHYFLLMRGQI